MPVTASVFVTIATASGTAVDEVSSWIPLNIHQTPFNVGFGTISHGNGDITYRVEHTFDDVMSGVSARVFIHEDVSAQDYTGTSGKDGNYAFGIRAMRVAIVSASSSGGVELIVVQTGI